MTELYQRVLLWHKLIAQTTGGLALCSAKHRLNRDEAQNWATMLRNVSDEMQEVLAGRPFILDDKGRRGVGSPGGEARFFTKEAGHDVAPATKTDPDFRPLVGAQPVKGLKVARRKNA